MFNAYEERNERSFLFTYMIKNIQKCIDQRSQRNQEVFQNLKVKNNLIHHGKRQQSYKCIYSTFLFHLSKVYFISYLKPAAIIKSIALIYTTVLHVWVLHFHALMQWAEKTSVVMGDNSSKSNWQKKENILLVKINNIAGFVILPY